MTNAYEEPGLFEHLCSTEVLKAGFKQVKKNKGKPGIDGMSIADFETCLDEENAIGADL